MSKISTFSGADVNNLAGYKNAHEILDAVIDLWCDEERVRRHQQGFPQVSKLELKKELGRAVGLGNGDDENSAAKGIYRYCSGETPLSIEKALQICRHINNYELIQWLGYQSGMLMTHRSAIHTLDGSDDSDIFEEIVKCLKETTKFVETLSSTYHQKASITSLNTIESMFMKALLQMEKCRLMLKKLIETMLKPGTQGEFWLKIPVKDKKKRGKDDR